MADTLLNMKAFLATVETGTFSAAARKTRLSPSVVLKRVNELEAELHSPLFRRTTRRVVLSDVGQLYLPRIRQLVKEYEDLRAGTFRSPGALEGRLRLKAQSVPTLAYLGKLLTEFQSDNPRLELEVVLTEWPGNPIEEGFDIAIGLDVASYEGVAEVRLQPYPRVICAAPAYTERRGIPRDPRDLADHDCLAFSPAGMTWSFNTPKGPLSIELRPPFATNNPQLLYSAACDGNGITQLSMLIAEPGLRSGALITLLEDFPLVDRWMKVMVPENRLHLARVKALLKLIVARCSTKPEALSHFGPVLGQPLPSSTKEI